MEFISIDNGYAVIKLGKDDINDITSCFAKEIEDLEIFGTADIDKNSRRERLDNSRRTLVGIFNDVKSR